jgi:hypothetical protein
LLCADLSLGGSFLFRSVFPFCFMNSSTPRGCSSEIVALHKCYCQMTHLNIRLPAWERRFAAFLAAGYTVDDLQTVLGHLLRENKRMNGAHYSLHLDRLLDFEHAKFDILLAEAKARQRSRPKRTHQERALQEWRGLPTKTGTSNTAQPAGSIAAALLKKLKESVK